jgi:hypothetical protein
VDLVLGLFLQRKKFELHSLKFIFCTHLALGKLLLEKLTLFLSGHRNGPDLIIFPEQLPFELRLHKAHLMLTMLFKLKQVGHQLINLHFKRSVFLMTSVELLLRRLTGLDENVDI